MATKFLRKIILEELKNVLEEQGYTPASGVTGMSKSTPKPGSVDFMGPEQPTAIPGSGTEIKSSPKRIATMKLQKKLAELGFLDKKDIDGVLGPKTTAAFNASMEANSKTALNTADIQKIPVSDINTMVSALSIGDKAQLQKIAVKYRVGQATAAADAALKASQSKSATPEDNPNKGPLPLDVLTPAEREKLLKLEKESLTREIKKLLRSL